MIKTDFARKLIVCIITALFLMGMAPCFTFAQGQSAAASEGGSVKALSDGSSQNTKADVPKTSGTSVVVMDMGSGEVIYEKNADKVREPASTTKILNLMVLLDNMDLDREITVSDDVETTGSILGLQPGEKMSAMDMIYGMMLVSGNDAAEELAKACGGSVDSFCEMMNEKARECGATHTDYRNANGLNEDEDKLNHTTAMDLALMARQAMKNDTFRKIVSTAKYTIPETNKEDERKLTNSNLCLWLTKEKVEIDGKEIPLKYQGCTGIKTGFTSSAGNCFVGSARRGNSEFLVVTMNAGSDPDRFEDAIRLWDYAFDNFKTYTALRASKSVGTVKVKRGALRDVKIGTSEDLKVTVSRSSTPSKNVTIRVVTDRDRVTAPVKKGQKLGTVYAYDENDKLLGSAELHALEKVDQGGILSYIGIADEDLPIFLAAAGTLLLIVVIIVILVRRRDV